MAQLKGSVGEGGTNGADDVRAVKVELNRRVHMIGMPMLAPGSVYTPSIATIIRRFQVLVLRQLDASGVVEPGDETARALFGVSVGAQVAAAQEALSSLSGAEWWEGNKKRFADSTDVSELASGFAENAHAFIAALRKGGATVHVEGTRRNKDRAYLMHYSWQIATGAMEPREVPADEDVGIIWDHGDPIASRDAAQELVEAFDIEAAPPLESSHLDGRAIDMTIDWGRAIQVCDAKGAGKLLDRPRSAARNELLHDVGRSYGVRKLRSDARHWSMTGS